MAPESLLLKLTRSRLLVRGHLPGRVARSQSDCCRDQRDGLSMHVHQIHRRRCSDLWGRTASSAGECCSWTRSPRPSSPRQPASPTCSTMAFPVSGHGMGCLIAAEEPGGLKMSQDAVSCLHGTVSCPPSNALRSAASQSSTTCSSAARRRRRRAGCTTSRPRRSPCSA